MRDIFKWMFFCISVQASCYLGSESTDDPVAYPYSRHHDQRSTREIEDCKQYSYGNMTNVQIPGHTGDMVGNRTVPMVELHHTTQTVGEYWNSRDVLMHVAYIADPLHTVSVYEPRQEGTCSPGNNVTATVRETAENRHCVLAVNAGFFNTTSKECLGSIISDGRWVQDSGGVHNAHFGLRRNGSLLFGYLSEIDLVAEDFLQLVGGVIWVLKDGELYVDESIAAECRDTEETGTLYTFASVLSARTLVGSDKHGRLVIVQIEGKTGRNGASLYDAANLMKNLGVVNAINLDGGGSSSMVVNGTLVNYASDFCDEDKRFQCERKVTTVLCIHEPYCSPPNCSGHGTCVAGQCRCHGNWAGLVCDRLSCPDNCSGHGVCTEDGCMCVPGYHGNTCLLSCLDGWYGDQCSQQCMCQYNASCSPVDGSCQCLPGFTGELCQHVCSYGYYGDGCSSQCACADGCTCDAVTGSCNHTAVGEELTQVGTCIAKKLGRQKKLDDDMTSEYRKALFSLVSLAVVASLSVTVNIVLIWFYFTKWRQKDAGTSYNKAEASDGGRTFVFQRFANSSFTTSTSSSEAETIFVKKHKKKRKGKSVS